MWGGRPNPNARQTGSNEASLGSTRKWGGGDAQGPPPNDSYGGGGDRGRSDQRGGGGGGGGYQYEQRGAPPMGQQQGGYGGGDRGPPPQGHHDNGPPRSTTASYGITQSAPVGDAATGERKRKSRWGDEKAVGGMPTALTGGVQGKDLDLYAGEFSMLLLTTLHVLVHCGETQR